MKDKLTIINCKEHDKAVCDHSDYYGETMTERRERFNNIINGINMVLMNNIVDVDDTVLDNWLQRNPMGNDECEFQYPYTDGKHCIVHDKKTAVTNDECEDYEGDAEIYQWYAIGYSDADYLKRHNQYVTFSDLLDTHFLAITHYGTSWDYVDSMVNDILGDSSDE